jgi:DNA-binding winged helix-turn-helix (wHTH) protein/TolB-like protein
VDFVSGVAASKSSRRYRFADLTLDLGQHRLWRADEEIALSKLSFDLMRVLVEAAPNLLTHDDLAAKVWGPRRIITAENLVKRVMMLRQALGDQADAPRYIEGVRGQGYRLVPEVEIVDAAPRVASRHGASGLRKVRYAVAGLALMALGLVGAVRYASRDTERASIALLRCENQSAAGEDAGFIGVGLRNELLVQLGRIDALRVVESTPVGQFGAEHRVRDVGRQLGVASILTCTVQRAGDTLLVHAQLFDAETEEQSWSERYERELSAESLFTIQRNIAASIASILKLRLTAEEAEAIRPTDNLQAWAFYVKGVNGAAYTHEDARRAIGQLDSALALDSNFIEALAMKSARLADYTSLAPADDIARFVETVRRDSQRAVDLRGESVLIRALHAYVLDDLGDWIDAEREHQAVFDLGGRKANSGYARHLLSVGDFVGARGILEAMIERDPANGETLAYLFTSHGLLGDTAQEEAVFERGEDLFAGAPWLGQLHENWFRIGRTGTVDASTWKLLGWDLSPYLDSPRAGLDEIARLAQTEELDNNVHKINLAMWAAHFGDDEAAVQLLTAAYEHTAMNSWLIWMPVFQKTRQRPEFERLLHDLGLVDYWDEFDLPDFCRRVDGHIRCN